MLKNIQLNITQIIYSNNWTILIQFFTVYGGFYEKIHFVPWSFLNAKKCWISVFWIVIFFEHPICISNGIKLKNIYKLPIKFIFLFFNLNFHKQQFYIHLYIYTIFSNFWQNFECKIMKKFSNFVFFLGIKQTVSNQSVNSKSIKWRFPAPRFRGSSITPSSRSPRAGFKVDFIYVL